MWTPQQIGLALIAAPAVMVAVLLAAERVWPARRETGQTWLNIGNAVYSHGLRLVLQPVLMLFVVRLTGGLPSLGIDKWPLYLGAPLYVAAMDLGEYAYHRLQHTVPLLWRIHSMHHSDPNMNVSTTDRHWWGDIYIKAVLFWAPLAALMHPSDTIVLIYSVVTLYIYFVHANLPVTFGRFSWVLNSPALHRRHHSSRPEHFNANYASMFPIFDVIFGSYRRPDAHPDAFPPTGLAAAPKSLADTVVWPIQAASR